MSGATESPPTLEEVGGLSSLLTGKRERSSTTADMSDIRNGHRSMIGTPMGTLGHIPTFDRVLPNVL